MESVNTMSHKKNYLILSGSVLVACIALFFLDKEVNHLSDILHHIPALLTYSVPTFFACFFLYQLFLRKNGKSESLYLSLALGLPLGITSIILILLLLYHFFP